ncbi:MAG: hypothetical protein AB8B78_06195 [Polaribacter sp.]
MKLWNIGTLFISSFSIALIQIRKIIVRKIDEKSIITKINKIKNLYPDASIKDIESFIKNTQLNQNTITCKKET